MPSTDSWTRYIKIHLSNSVELLLPLVWFAGAVDVPLQVAELAYLPDEVLAVSSLHLGVSDVDHVLHGVKKQASAYELTP